MEKGLFTEKQKQEFIGSVRAKKTKRETILRDGLSLPEAFTCAYLDVARAPLRGIAKAVGGDSKKVREECIEEIIVPLCTGSLLKAKCTVDFDNAHKELGDRIREYYDEKKYEFFIVGKTQKWINMALKYACIYANEYAGELQEIFRYCHIPIDRYIANPIARELQVPLPEYKGFVMPPCDIFDANKHNYSWSKIDDYQAYLTCQNAIREALGQSTPAKCALEWEFEWWLKEKQKK